MHDAFTRIAKVRSECFRSDRVQLRSEARGNLQRVHCC